MHKVWSEALWAHHMTVHGATEGTLFQLIYGQEAIFPVEVNPNALKEMLKYKVYVARVYNKKVNFKYFQVDLF